MNNVRHRSAASFGLDSHVTNQLQSHWRHVMYVHRKKPYDPLTKRAPVCFNITIMPARSSLIYVVVSLIVGLFVQWCISLLLIFIRDSKTGPDPDRYGWTAKNGTKASADSQTWIGTIKMMRIQKMYRLHLSAFNFILNFPSFCVTFIVFGY